MSTTRYVKNPSSKFHNPYDIERNELVGQIEKMRVNLDLQMRNSSIAALEGGLPGQRLRLHNAGQFIRIILIYIYFRGLARVADHKDGRFSGVHSTFV